MIIYLQNRLWVLDVLALYLQINSDTLSYSHVKNMKAKILNQHRGNCIRKNIAGRENVSEEWIIKSNICLVSKEHKIINM